MQREFIAAIGYKHRLLHPVYITGCVLTLGTTLEYTPVRCGDFPGVAEQSSRELSAVMRGEYKPRPGSPSRSSIALRHLCLPFRPILLPGLIDFDIAETSPRPGYEP